MTGHLTKLRKMPFVKELDKALLEGRTMLSVHSLKDMPMEVPEDLPLLAFSRREDPRDVLVLPEGASQPGSFETSGLFQSSSHFAAANQFIRI